MAEQHNTVKPFTISDSLSETDPATNPTLTLNCMGREYVEFYVSEPTGVQDVNIYGSLTGDAGTFRLTTTYITNGAGIATDMLITGYQWVRIEIDNIAAGAYLIEMSCIE